MQMMKTTASTGPITQMRPSSPSTMGWGSGLSSWKGSEKGLAANVCRTVAGDGPSSVLAVSRPLAGLVPSTSLCSPWPPPSRLLSSGAQQ